MKNKKHPQYNKPAKLSGHEREGLLMTTFGAQAELEDEHGNVVHCHIRKNADPVITGDRVYWLSENDGTGTIIGPLPRKSLLVRPENKYKLKPIAANIDAIIITTAPPPVLAEDMIDRYLVAAELLKIEPIILLNKEDLLDESSAPLIKARLAIYEKIGYRVIYSSIFSRDGLKALENFLKDKTCVLVGPSGVGKSSIIAALTEHAVKTREVSEKTGLGKHTTTTTHLYHLPQGGNLIDSPGVREFGLWHINPEELLQGFKEFHSFSGRCKFRNCTHQREPHCAMQQALQEGNIDDKRFQSYCKILASLTSR